MLSMEVEKKRKKKKIESLNIHEISKMSVHAVLKLFLDCVGQWKIAISRQLQQLHARET